MGAKNESLFHKRQKWRDLGYSEREITRMEDNDMILNTGKDEEQAFGTFTDIGVADRATMEQELDLNAGAREKARRLGGKMDRQRLLGARELIEEEERAKRKIKALKGQEAREKGVVSGLKDDADIRR